MGLSMAMNAAVHAIRACAGSFDCIARRKSWRVETAVNSREELVICVLIRPETENEWVGPVPTLGVAMDAAVHAIRVCAASIDCIARRPGWRVETAVNKRGALAICVHVPREFEGEWEGERRTAAACNELPLAKCPPAVARLGSALVTTVKNRGIQSCRLRVLQRSFHARDVWVFEVSVDAPDEREAQRLKNHR